MLDFNTIKERTQYDLYINQILDQFNENRKIIFTAATGFGKSYIAKEIIHDIYNKTNGDCIFLIVYPKCNNQTDWEKNLSEYNDHIDYCTYTGLKKLYEQVDDLYYDLIIFDEAHRLGSEIHGKVYADKLINSLKEAKVLGLTATPQRYSDGINVCEYFDINIKAPDVAECIERKILPSFKYVSCYYGLKEYADEIKQKAIKTGKYNDFLKKKFNIIANILSIDKIIEKNLHKGNHKIIVFYTNSDELNKVRKTMKFVFPDSEEYFISCKYSKEKNKIAQENFEKSTAKVAIIYSVNKLIEGPHINGVDVLIMFRLTNSLGLYKQMIGRLLNTKYADVTNLIVFDFVGNSVRIRDGKGILNLLSKVTKSDENAVEKTKEYGANIVEDYTKDCVEMLKEVEKYLEEDPDKSEAKLFCKNNNISWENFIQTKCRHKFTSYKETIDYYNDLFSENQDLLEAKLFCKENNIQWKNFIKIKSSHKFTSYKETIEYYNNLLPEKQGKLEAKLFCKENNILWGSFCSSKSIHKFTYKETIEYYNNLLPERQDLLEAKLFCKENNIPWESFIRRKIYYKFTYKETIEYYNNLFSESQDLLEAELFCKENNIPWRNFLSIKRKYMFTYKETIEYYNNLVSEKQNKTETKLFCKENNIPWQKFCSAKNNYRFTYKETIDYFKGKIPTPSGRFYKPRNKREA